MWDLDTIRKLHNQVERGGMPLAFTTLVIPRYKVASGYPGGLIAFKDRFPHACEAWGLVAVSAMSTGEIQELIDHVRQNGLVPKHDLGVCDQFAGPLVTCPQIEFYATRPDRPLALAWKAVLRRYA